MQRIALLLFILCALASARASARDYFVSPAGSDANPGTFHRPFATPGQAAAVLKPGDTCYLREGVYRQVLRPAVSGTPGRPITYTAYRNEKAVISGTDIIRGWKEEKEGVCSAPLTWSLGDGDQIFADGRMLSEARWPNAGENLLFQPRRAETNKGTPTSLLCDQLTGPDNAWNGAQLWCAGGSQWICWTGTVTGYDAKNHTLTFEPAKEKWYTPRRGNPFVLRGHRRALDAPGEWFYDAISKRLLLIPPQGTPLSRLRIEAKRRQIAIDLRGRSHIRIRGISLWAAGLATDKQSSHLVLEKLHGRYVAHSFSKDTSGRFGILIRGDNHLLLNCDLGYSSSSVLSVGGRDHRIINCRIHHGGYAGLWRGTVALAGRRILFSHNTVRHAGRDLINTHGLMESLVQYNDVSDAGWLTCDLGMFYGHNTDFANTVFHHNLVHDNHARHCSMGIYFDHLSHNAIVHHNIVWNVRHDPIRFNNPSYNNLVFNNSCWQSGNITTFDHSRRNDLFACRYFSNIFNGKVNLPKHVAVENNVISAKPPFRDAAGGDFRLTDPKLTNVGACAPDEPMWRAGCDPENPPDPLPVYAPPRIAGMNLLKNACFEFGTLESWTPTDARRAKPVKGNGWGNSGGPSKMQPTGTSRFELRLGPGCDGVEQVVTGLSPNTRYTVSAWLRVSDPSESVELAVRGHGQPEVRIAASQTQWTRQSLTFTTGPRAAAATIRLRTPPPCKGHAWADNLTLPLTSQ